MSTTKSWYEEWLGLSMIFTGGAIDLFFVFSDVDKRYVLTGLPELEVELIGIVLVLFGALIDFYLAHS